MSGTDKSYARELVRRSTGREVPDVLRDLYVVRRHSQEEIAVALGVSRAAIGAWLRLYGISRDERPPVVLEAAG